MAASSNVAREAIAGRMPRTLEALGILCDYLEDGQWHSLASCVEAMSVTGLTRGYMRRIAADAYELGIIERRGRKHRRHYAKHGTPWPTP